MPAVLGKTVAAPRQYAPDILEPIPRSIGRDTLGGVDLTLLHGCDVWHLYELSWLNERGVPQVYAGVLTIPCDSPATVESKSLKLYLNSLNFHRFSSPQLAGLCIEQDLSALTGSAVALQLIPPSDLVHITREPSGTQLDELAVTADTTSTDRGLLLAEGTDRTEGASGVFRYLSHGLRSLCPVTGQPDWASIVIEYGGSVIDPERLAAYIYSYRDHQEYHEQCVERIFYDLQRAVLPEELIVTAFYQRRGGIDITPWRSLKPLTAPADRMARQ